MFMKKNLLIVSLFLFLIITGVLLALNRERVVSFFDREKDCVPYNMLVTKEKSDIIINWETKDVCTGIVKFGSDIEDLKHWLSSSVVEEKNRVLIDSSKYKDISYFVIISNGEIYGLDGKAISIN